MFVPNTHNILFVSGKGFVLKRNIVVDDRQYKKGSVFSVMEQAELVAAGAPADAFMEKGGRVGGVCGPVCMTVRLYV